MNLNYADLQPQATGDLRVLSETAKGSIGQAMTVSAQMARDFIEELLKASPPLGDLPEIFARIDELNDCDDDDDYDFIPTCHALRNAKVAIKGTYRFLSPDTRRRLPVPEVMPDGTGGVVIQWTLRGRTLNAYFRPSARSLDSFYYEAPEAPGGYYAKAISSVSQIQDRLNALVRG